MSVESVVSVVVGLCALAITGFVVPWIKNKISEEKFDEVSKWVEVAVSAAEQLGVTGALEKSEKYQYVKTFLESKGYELDETEIKVLIESAVNNLPEALTACLSATADTVKTESED